MKERKMDVQICSHFLVEQLMFKFYFILFFLGKPVFKFYFCLDQFTIAKPNKSN